MSIQKKATEIINEVSPILAAKYGVPVAFPKIEINKRMFRCFGKATVNILLGIFKIELSGKVYEGRTDTSAFRNTVIHELCHLYEYQLKGRLSHSQVWAELMETCGEVASQHVTDDKVKEVEFERFVKPKRTYMYSCACQSHSVNVRQNYAMKQGVVFKCNRCKSPLKPE